MSFLNKAIQFFGIILLCDFITGLVHWAEDSFGTPETPIIGKLIIAPNWEHHQRGQAFLKKSWLASNWDLYAINLIVLAVAAFFNALSWQLILACFILANANQIHKWAHIPKPENKPKIITLLHKLQILQTTKQHGRHHRKPNDVCYCTVTNVLNPLLDSIKFWRGLEFVLSKFNIKAHKIS